jgi:Arylsulfotransferase (ASST)
MLPRVNRLAPALVALAMLAAGCSSSKSEKSAAPKKPAGPPPPTQHFISRPDLKPPPVRVLTDARTAPGYIFLAPKMKVVQAGPMILDNNGNVVWFNPLDTHGVSDFRVQLYNGKPVLTWWRGQAPMGVGTGRYVIYDDTYHQIGQVRAGHGYAGDIHDFVITRRNTALFPIYHQVKVDLTSVGGPKDGRIFDGIFQEVNIKTGRVLFEWHSWPAVGLEESYTPAPKPPAKGKKAPPYDYFHINSVELEPNGNYLISARNTHAVYEIDGKTGKILWRLGGKKSDFKMGPGTNFEWQHDARLHSNGTITLFDNGAAPPIEKFTRILVLRVNEKTKRATLVRSYHHPKRLLVPFEGNAQFLPDGHVFVGWGAVPYVTEFDASGQVVLDLSFGKGIARITKPDQDADSYRAYRFAWRGHPTDRPAIAVRGNKVFVSWNGATDVARWQVELDGQPAGTVSKTHFESALPLGGKAKRITVVALDASGREIGRSRTISP